MFPKEDLDGFFFGSHWDLVEGNSGEKPSLAICQRSRDRMTGLLEKAIDIGWTYFIGDTQPKCDMSGNTLQFVWHKIPKNMGKGILYR